MTVYSIVYDRWRKQCASGSMDNTVKVWDVVNGTCLHTLEGHSSLVGLLGISPSYLVSAAADASLKVWDADTGTIKHTLTSHSGAITCFQHDESKVVSGSDGALKLWDVKTGAFVRDLVTNISSVWQVEFSGSRLVAASARSNGTVFDVFDFGPLNDPSGVDDDDLDLCVRPAWERGDPREPLQYQQLADGQIKLGRTSFTSNDFGKRTRKYLRQAATTAGAATTTPLRRTRLRGEGSSAGSSRIVPIMPATETSPTPNPSSFAPIFDETLDELSDDDVEMS
jgi:F-box and WD-40 domain protein CDC4